MAFVSNRELEGTAVGCLIKLDHDVDVLKGRFKLGYLEETLERYDETI